jgi:hypothetical protein
VEPGAKAARSNLRIGLARLEWLPVWATVAHGEQPASNRRATGEQVLVGLGAANRDPAVYADPDQLDVTRHAHRHLAFGHGPHHCLGAPLARLEAAIAFGRLLDRFPDMRLAVPRSELACSDGDGLVLRGLAELPVVLGPDRGHGPANPPITPTRSAPDDEHA